MKAVAAISDRIALRLALELPPAEVERAAGAGSLRWSLGLDSFHLER